MYRPNNATQRKSIVTNTFIKRERSDTFPVIDEVETRATVKYSVWDSSRNGTTDDSG